MSSQKNTTDQILIFIINNKNEKKKAIYGEIFPYISAFLRRYLAGDGFIKNLKYSDVF